MPGSDVELRDESFCILLRVIVLFYIVNVAVKYTYRNEHCSIEKEKVIGHILRLLER